MDSQVKSQGARFETSFELGINRRIWEAGSEKWPGHVSTCNSSNSAVGGWKR